MCLEVIRQYRLLSRVPMDKRWQQVKGGGRGPHVKLGSAVAVLTGQRTAYLPGHPFRKQSWLSGLNAMLVQPGAAGTHMHAQEQPAFRCLSSML